MTKEEIQKVTHTKHVLLRPDSYVGVTSKSSDSFWILEGEKFKLSKLSVSLALWKIFDEILVNAIDRNTQFPKEVTAISVLVDKENGIISVENNGPLGGISVEKHSNVTCICSY